MTIATVQPEFDTITYEGLLKRGYHIWRDASRRVKPLQHYHPGFEIVLPHTGVVDVFYGNTGSKLTAGEACLGPGHITHGAQGLYTCTVIHFDGDLASPDSHSLLRDIEKTTDPCFVSLTHDTLRRIIWISKELEQTDPRNNHDFQIAGKLLDVVLTEIRMNLETPKEECNEAQLLHHILLFMAQNIASLKSIDGLAKHFGISRSHMFNLFITHIGCGPGKYWRQMRLDRARELLETTSTTVEGIAATVGFQSLRGFQRAFQQHFGMSASTYRDVASSSRVPRTTT